MNSSRSANIAVRRALPLLGLSAVLAFALGGRRWGMHWGATKAEVDMPLPGDDLLANAELIATRAITIHAPAAEVWPWIIQMGQGRAGFYSYDFLENLMGCDIHSANRIEPRWQSVAVGQDFKLHPEMSMMVAQVQHESAMVVRGSEAFAGSAPPPFDSTWAFVLLEAPEHTTRLISRERYQHLRPWAPVITEPTQIASSVMSRKMLRGIKSRVELTTK